MKLDLVISMPIYNEGDQILRYIADIALNFRDVSFLVVVVDDHSTDGTHHLLGVIDDHTPIDYLRNQDNVGHGPSTLRGLAQSLRHSPISVLAIDGDGDVSGKELREFYSKAKLSGHQIIEGVRTNRFDPLFRVMVSALSRASLRLLGAGQLRDANTPVRFYTREALEVLLEETPRNSMVPNLMFSLLTRRMGLDVSEIDVTYQVRVRQMQGTTWRARYRTLPSLKFVKFCIKATFEIVRFRIRPPK